MKYNDCSTEFDLDVILAKLTASAPATVPACQFFAATSLRARLQAKLESQITVAAAKKLAATAQSRR